MYSLEKQLRVAKSSNSFLMLIVGINRLLEEEKKKCFTSMPTVEDFSRDLIDFQDWLKEEVIPAYKAIKEIKSIWFGFDDLNMDIDCNPKNIEVGGLSTKDLDGDVYAPTRDYLSGPLREWLERSPRTEHSDIILIGWVAYIAFLVKNSMHILKGYDILIGSHCGSLVINY